MNFGIDIDRDGILHCKISATLLIAFMSLLMSAIAWSWSSDQLPITTPAINEIDLADTNETVDAVPPDLPIWKIDYTLSAIKFTGTQAGTRFSGAWENWSATLRFAEDRLTASAFDVIIDTGSANTNDFHRDITLQDSEWFDTENFPEARFRANRFSTSAGRYIADGELTVKGVAFSVRFLFTVEAEGDVRILTGTSQLDRLEIGIGTGEWEDAKFIGRSVLVEVRVKALQE